MAHSLTMHTLTLTRILAPTLIFLPVANHHGRSLWKEEEEAAGKRRQDEEQERYLWQLCLIEGLRIGVRTEQMQR